MQPEHPLRDASELSPRVRVFIESALELIDETGVGPGELRIMFEDGKVRRWRIESGWHGAHVLGRYDKNRLDPADG
jgi:hypothetical protein